MAREDLHFRLRIPEDLKQRIEAAADGNNRSMTAEMVARLQGSFDPTTGSAETARLTQALEKSEKIRELEGRVMEAISQQNDLLTKAAILSESAIYRFARAFWMNAQGDSSELDNLVKTAKENPASMVKLMSVHSIKEGE